MHKKPTRPNDDANICGEFEDAARKYTVINCGVILMML